jgi:tetratricopeptide (TPR) repeat protein
MAIQCQQCKHTFTEDQVVSEGLCPACDLPYNIKNYKTVSSMPLPQVNKYISTIQTQIAENPQDKMLNSSLGICFLKLKLYDKALPKFELAMEDNYSDPAPYFYAAICLLKGKKAFLAMRPEIDKIESYLDAAISLDPRGIFYYFRSYIRYDYFSRKSYKVTPVWQEFLQNANNAGVSQDDITEFYQICGVERPDCL